MFDPLSTFVTLASMRGPVVRHFDEGIAIAPLCLQQDQPDKHISAA